MDVHGKVHAVNPLNFLNIVVVSSPFWTKVRWKKLVHLLIGLRDRKNIEKESVIADFYATKAPNC
jgi:hypothetical protein